MAADGLAPCAMSSAHIHCIDHVGSTWPRLIYTSSAICVLWIDRKCKLFLYFLKRIIPVAQIPQCNGPISHNVPFCNRYVHIPDAKWCIVRYLTNALWGWCHGSIQQVKECTKSVSSLRKCHLQNLWLFFVQGAILSSSLNISFKCLAILMKNYWMYFSVILWHSKAAGCWNSPSRKIINMLH